MHSRGHTHPNRVFAHMQFFTCARATFRKQLVTLLNLWATHGQILVIHTSGAV